MLPLRFRNKRLFSEVIPGIPVTPVGYDDAQRILEYMDGPSVTVRKS